MIDIGANLAHESFDADREALLERARKAGVQAIVVTGSSRDSSRRALELAQARPGYLFATAGLHPHHADDYDAEHEAVFRDLLEHPACVAGGECGLDYFRDFSPRADQRRAFEAQLRLAIDAGKPVFLHQRDAHVDFLPILREHRPQLVDAVVHCFTDTAEAMADYLALDCHIGITGWICDERRGTHLLEVVRDIPAARLLVETDAPYLLPRNLPRALRPVDGRRNEPRFLPWVVAKIADARGESADLVASQTARNARAFFALA